MTKVLLEEIPVWYLLKRKSLSPISCKKENCVEGGLDNLTPMLKLVLSQV